MKSIRKEKAIWGIWMGAQQSWMRFSDGSVFWTTHLAVAEAQLQDCSFTDKEDAGIKRMDNA